MLVLFVTPDIILQLQHAQLEPQLLMRPIVSIQLRQLILAIYVLQPIIIMQEFVQQEVQLQVQQIA